MGSLKWPANGQKVFQSVAADSAGRFPHPLGARGEDVFGRQYRYAVAGGSSLVVGNALQAAAQITNHQELVPTATAIGANKVNVTPGATGGAENLYAGGMLIVSTTPGLGYAYPVKSHAEITASVAFDVYLAAGWEIQVALTTSSRLLLTHNAFKNVIQFPATTATNALVGVAVYPITNAEGGWIGRTGLFGTLVQGTPAVGTMVGCPATTAGAVGVIAGTDAAIPAMVAGYLRDTGENGEVSPVEWTLP